MFTIGAYDGVHRGHQAVIAGGAASSPPATGAKSAVMTFDRHPASVVRPESAPKLLTDLEQKLELLAATGLDATIVIHFDEEQSREEPAHFVRRVLIDCLDTSIVVVGEDFHFGRDREGNVDLLRELGADGRLRGAAGAAGAARRRGRRADQLDRDPARARRRRGRAGRRAARPAVRGARRRRGRRPARAAARLPDGQRRGAQRGVRAGRRRVRRVVRAARTATSTRAPSTSVGGRRSTSTPTTRCSRPTCSTSTATSTASGPRCASPTSCAASASSTASTRWSPS